MALIKIVCFFAFVEVVLSMEHHLFGIPLPHVNDPIIHNVGNLVIHGVEDITGIHSKANDQPMNVGNASMGRIEMSAGGSTAGMNMGGRGEERPLDDIGTLLGLSGGVTAPKPVAKTSVLRTSVPGGEGMNATGSMTGTNMGGGGEKSHSGEIGTLLGLGDGVTAPTPVAKISVSRASVSGGKGMRAAGSRAGIHIGGGGKDSLLGEIGNLLGLGDGVTAPAPVAKILVSKTSVSGGKGMSAAGSKAGTNKEGVGKKSNLGEIGTLLGLGGGVTAPTPVAKILVSKTSVSGGKGMSAAGSRAGIHIGGGGKDNLLGEIGTLLGLGGGVTAPTPVAKTSVSTPSVSGGKGMSAAGSQAGIHIGVGGKDSLLEEIGTLLGLGGGVTASTPVAKTSVLRTSVSEGKGMNAAGSLTGTNMGGGGEKSHSGDIGTLLELGDGVTAPTPVAKISVSRTSVSGGKGMSAAGSRAGTNKEGGGKKSNLGEIGTLLGLGGGVTAPAPVAKTLVSKTSVSGGKGMSAAGSRAGIHIGGGGKDSLLGEIGTLLGLGGGVTAPAPVAKTSVSTPSVSGGKGMSAAGSRGGVHIGVGGKDSLLGEIRTLLGLGGGVTAPAPVAKTSVSKTSVSGGKGMSAAGSRAGIHIGVGGKDSLLSEIGTLLGLGGGVTAPTPVSKTSVSKTSVSGGKGMSTAGSRAGIHIGVGGKDSLLGEIGTLLGLGDGITAPTPVAKISVSRTSVSGGKGMSAAGSRAETNKEGDGKKSNLGEIGTLSGLGDGVTAPTPVAKTSVSNTSVSGGKGMSAAGSRAGIHIGVGGKDSLLGEIGTLLGLGGGVTAPTPVSKTSVSKTSVSGGKVMSAAGSRAGIHIGVGGKDSLLSEIGTLLGLGGDVTALTPVSKTSVSKTSVSGGKGMSAAGSRAGIHIRVGGKDSLLSEIGTLLGLGGGVTAPAPVAKTSVSRPSVSGGKGMSAAGSRAGIHLKGGGKDSLLGEIGTLLGLGGGVTAPAPVAKTSVSKTSVSGGKGMSAAGSRAGIHIGVGGKDSLLGEIGTLLGLGGGVTAPAPVAKTSVSKSSVSGGKGMTAAGSRAGIHIEVGGKDSLLGEIGTLLGLGGGVTAPAPVAKTSVSKSSVSGGKGISAPGSRAGIHIGVGGKDSLLGEIGTLLGLGGGVTAPAPVAKTSVSKTSVSGGKGMSAAGSRAGIHIGVGGKDSLLGEIGTLLGLGGGVTAPAPVAKTSVSKSSVSGGKGMTAAGSRAGIHIEVGGKDSLLGEIGTLLGLGGGVTAPAPVAKTSVLKTSVSGGKGISAPGSRAGIHIGVGGKDSLLGEIGTLLGLGGGVTAPAPVAKTSVSKTSVSGGKGMSAAGSRAGIHIGVGGKDSLLGEIGTLLGLGGGVTAPAPVAKTSVSKSSVSGGKGMTAAGSRAGIHIEVGGKDSLLGEIGTLLGLGGGVTAPAPVAKTSVSKTSVTENNQIVLKELLKYIQYLKAQKAKEGSSSASSSVSGSSPSLDAILKYLVENTKPAQTQKTVLIRTQGADSAEVQKKLAAV